MTQLLDDDELWRRLKLLKVGYFAGFLRMCGVSLKMGTLIRRKLYAAGPVIREKLSRGFEDIDSGRVDLVQTTGEHPGIRGRCKVIAVYKEKQHDVATVAPLQYPAMLLKQIAGAGNGYPNLALPPMPTRIRRGY